jgi:hypothetical protein
MDLGFLLNDHEEMSWLFRIQSNDGTVSGRKVNTGRARERGERKNVVDNGY